MDGLENFEKIREAVLGVGKQINPTKEQIIALKDFEEIFNKFEAGLSVIKEKSGFGEEQIWEALNSQEGKYQVDNVRSEVKCLNNAIKREEDANSISYGVDSFFAFRLVRHAYVLGVLPTEDQQADENFIDRLQRFGRDTNMVRKFERGSVNIEVLPADPDTFSKLQEEKKELQRHFMEPLECKSPEAVDKKISFNHTVLGRGYCSIGERILVTLQLLQATVKSEPDKEKCEKLEIFRMFLNDFSTMTAKAEEIYLATNKRIPDCGYKDIASAEADPVMNNIRATLYNGLKIMNVEVDELEISNISTATVKLHKIIEMNKKMTQHDDKQAPRTQVDLNSLKEKKPEANLTQPNRKIASFRPRTVEPK